VVREDAEPDAYAGDARSRWLSWAQNPVASTERASLTAFFLSGTLAGAQGAPSAAEMRLPFADTLAFETLATNLQ
jgi:hypothetical protein